MEKMDWKEEYKQAFESNRLKRFFVVLSVVVICVSLILSGWLLMRILGRSPSFTVRSISVTGLSRLDEASLYAITKPYYNRNIFSVDLGLLRSKVSDIPWVRSVAVKRKLPDTIRIIVRERDPAALVNVKNDGQYRLFACDGNGLLLGEYGNMLTEGLPVITGLNLPGLFTGEKIPQRALVPLLSELADLRSRNRPLFSLLQEINVTESFGLVHYRVILTRRNIVMNTDTIDAGLFERLDALFRHFRGGENLKTVTALSNSLYVSEKT